MEESRQLVVWMVGSEEQCVDKECLQENNPHELIFAKKNEDLGSIGKMKGKKKEKEAKEEEKQVAAAEGERMSDLIPENETFIPDHEDDHQDHGEEKEKEFSDPRLNFFPPVSGSILFEVGDHGDHDEKDNVVLADEETQNPDDAGEPKPSVQGEEQREKNEHHRVEIRIDQGEYREKDGA